jgi:hypothetical protein
MTSCSTKIRTAALSANTRGRPGPWYGNSRCVRSISANNLPIVVLRSIVISRNCSQNSGSALIEVPRPLSLTLCTYCFMSGIRVAHTSETPTSRRCRNRHSWACRACLAQWRPDCQNLISGLLSRSGTPLAKRTVPRFSISWLRNIHMLTSAAWWRCQR